MSQSNFRIGGVIKEQLSGYEFGALPKMFLTLLTLSLRTSASGVVNEKEYLPLWKVRLCCHVLFPHILSFSQVWEEMLFAIMDVRLTEASSCEIKCFFFSTFHADVMLKESVCSHFLPTLCTLLPLSQVGVGVKARALVLRPPRVVGPYHLCREKLPPLNWRGKTLCVAQIVLFPTPLPNMPLLWFLDFCSPYFLPPASSTCNMVDGIIFYLVDFVNCFKQYKWCLKIRPLKSIFLSLTRISPPPSQTIMPCPEIFLFQKIFIFHHFIFICWVV